MNIAPPTQLTAIDLPARRTSPSSRSASDDVARFDDLLQTAAQTASDDRDALASQSESRSQSGTPSQVTADPSSPRDASTADESDLLADADAATDDASSQAAEDQPVDDAIDTTDDVPAEALIALAAQPAAVLVDDELAPPPATTTTASASASTAAQPGASAAALTAAGSSAVPSAAASQPAAPPTPAPSATSNSTGEQSKSAASASPADPQLQQAGESQSQSSQHDLADPPPERPLVTGPTAPRPGSSDDQPSASANSAASSPTLSPAAIQAAYSAESAASSDAAAQSNLASTSASASSPSPSSSADPAAASASASPLPGSDVTLDDTDRQRIADQTARALRAAVNQRGGTVTLRLNPPELGEVRIRLELNQTTVRASIDTASESVRTLLQQHANQLHSALASHGLTVEQLQVQTQPDLSGRQDRSASDDGRSKGSFQQNPQQQQTPGDPQRQNSRFQRELLDLVA
jgi:flagellar hook-length control protein FliK